MKETPRGWEVRERLGGSVRLEATIPRALGALRAGTRARLVEELCTSVRGLSLRSDQRQTARKVLRRLVRAETTEAAAKLEKVVRQFMREGPKEAPAPAKLVTFREFGLRWATGELYEEFPLYVRKTTPKTRKNYKTRVLALSAWIGDVPLAHFTNADAQRALKALMKKDPDLGRQSLRHYAQVIQSVIRKAVHPGGLIEATKYPLPVKGFLPILDNPPTYPILYPNDVVTLMRGPAPVWRKLLYAIAIYEGLRLSHILGLRWRNIDFANGLMVVGTSANVKAMRTHEMNEGVAAALQQFRGSAKLDDYIFPRLTPNEMLKLAGELRNDLDLAGVTRELRPDVYASGDGQEPMRFHDLRATFVSLHLAMGWNEVEIMLRTAHTSSKVLHHHYARRVDLAKVVLGKQGPLLPLDVALGWRAGMKVATRKATKEKA